MGDDEAAEGDAEEDGAVGGAPLADDGPGVAVRDQLRGKWLE